MRPEQEHVKNLLLDTVTLLCRNGLTYRCQLKIQGLLGITIDDDEVFIVHINEKIADNIENINDTNQADVDPVTTENRTSNESFTDLILPSEVQTEKSGPVQNMENGINAEILREFEDITSESVAQEGDFDVNPVVTAVSKIEQKSVSEQPSLRCEQVVTKVTREEKPSIEIALTETAEAIAKQMLLRHDDLLRINTTVVATGTRPVYINQMSSPAKLCSSNGVIGDLSVVQAASELLRANKRPHNLTRDQHGLRTVESDDDDDDDDDSSAAESFSSKRRRSLPSVTYPDADPSGSILDVPESKPYIPDFTPGVINLWPSVGGGIATGIGGRNYNGDNGGGTYGGLSLSNNMFAGDLSGMLSSVAGGGSNFLTNDQIMAKQREFYLTRNNHHSANSRLPRRPRESEEKHFGCPFCGLSYYYKKHLKFHLKQKHGL